MLSDLFNSVCTACNVLYFELNVLQSDFSEMGAFMSKGQADGWLRPVIGQQYPVERAADAHVEVIEHKTTTSGKIVLNL